MILQVLVVCDIVECLFEDQSVKVNCSMGDMKFKRWLLKGVDVVVRCIPSGLLSVPINDEGDSLSPLLYILLGLKRKAEMPFLYERSPEEGREQYRKDVIPLSANYAVKSISDFSIPFENRQLRIRHYSPCKNDVPAILVYFHGGGYVIGDIDTHDDICRLLSDQCGIQVLSVDYRLAPENPYPACIDDADFVVKWVQRNAEKFSIDEKSIMVGGDSAGATIAAATANNFSMTGNQVLAQLLIYPGTDRSSYWPSYEKFGYDYFLNVKDREWFYSKYTKNCLRLTEETNVSPLKFNHNSKSTAAVIVTSGFDVLRDEGYAYVDKLKASSADIEHLHFGRLTHGFVNLIGVHRESEKASIKISGVLRKMVMRLSP